MHMLPVIIKKEIRICGRSRRKMHLPSIVRQMGKVAGENRVYIEDYVYAYLKELKRKQRGFPVRAALYGHAFVKENIHFYLIYGASCITDEMERGRSQEAVQKTFFGAYRLIGYVNLYENQALPSAGEGCYIFYEANEAMQNYLLACRQLKGKDDKDKDFSGAGGQRLKGFLLFTYLREILLKTMLCLFTVLTAMAAAIIGNYSSMHEFTMMAAEALHKLE